MIMMMFAKSPFTRMIAVFIVESLIARGLISPENASQAVEDAISVIGYIAMAATLLIWQWRASHPAKTEIEKVIPLTEDDKKMSIQLRDRVNALTHKILDKIFITPDKSQ